MRHAALQANHFALAGLSQPMMRNVTTVDELSPDLVAMAASRIDAAVFEAAGPYEVPARLKLSDDEKR